LVSGTGNPALLINRKSAFSALDRLIAIAVSSAITSARRPAPRHGRWRASTNFKSPGVNRRSANP
jgi:hypothetical protein